MAEYDDREKFIPIRKGDVIDLLCGDRRLDADQQQAFREFAEILSARFHFSFHEDLEELKSCYHPFNPDADTVCLAPASAAEHAEKFDRLRERFDRVLHDANFEELTEEQINAALNEQSFGWALELHVDFREFEVLKVYARGLTQKPRKVRTWRSFFLAREVPIEVFERLALLLKFREPEKQRRGARNFSPEHVYLKLFKDIPRADLEMLFPNTAIRMRRLDKVKISIPFLIGLGTTLLKFGPLLLGLLLVALGADAVRDRVAASAPGLIDSQGGQALGFAAFAAIVGGLGLYMFKSVKNYLNMKTRYMATLTSSLYFLNLDNNAGVFQHLIDVAEEEEVKEALLAYYFINFHRPPAGEVWTERGLDDAVEQWIEAATTDARDLRLVDFEIDDAVDKLVALHIIVDPADAAQVAAARTALGGTLTGTDRERLLDLSNWQRFVRETKDQAGRWQAREYRVAPLAEAKVLLDYEWDNYFTFNQAGSA